VKSGDKTVEIRKADRDYRDGDYLLLLEFDPQKDALTGDYTAVRVTHILQPHDPPRGLCDGFVALSIAQDDDATKIITGQRKSMVYSPEEVRP
jgi:hypothetical protein